MTDDTFNETGSMIDGDGCTPGFARTATQLHLRHMQIDVRVASGTCDDGGSGSLLVLDEDGARYLNFNCPAFDWDGDGSCSDCLLGADACVDVSCAIYDYYADGYCDTVNNTEECGWDGGDCCEATCESGPDWDCGVVGYECRDPDYYEGGCWYNYTLYGSASCDTAYDEYGLTCEALESVYSWDCLGCDCPGDAPAPTPEEEAWLRLRRHLQAQRGWMVRPGPWLQASA